MSPARPRLVRPAMPLAAIGVVAALLLLAGPAAANSNALPAAAIRTLDRSVAYPGTAWGLDSRTNQVVVTVDRSAAASW